MKLPANAQASPMGPDGRTWLPPEEQERRRRQFYEMVARQLSDTSLPDLVVSKKGGRTQSFIMINEEGDDVGPTPERLEHAIGDDGELLGHQIDIRDHDLTWQAFSLRDSILGRLHYRKKPIITLQHLMAGERFYAVASDAGFIPSMQADTTRTIVDGGKIKNEADRMIAARELWDRIRRSMHPNQWHIVEALTVQEIPLAEYAERFRRIYSGGEILEVKEKRERQLIATDRLRSGLDWLIDFFCIGERRPGIRSSRGEAAHVITRDGVVEQRLPGRKEKAT